MVEAPARGARSHPPSLIGGSSPPAARLPPRAPRPRLGAEGEGFAPPWRGRTEVG